ncbi:hypothetical protein AB5I41_10875 [Sphingomonas sp. MMS24-JH45]
MSGGYSGIGAGYPGAIGDPTSGPAEKVYIAPNTSLRLHAGRVPAQDGRRGRSGLGAGVERAHRQRQRPAAWPWHDYGAAAWSGEGEAPSA